MPEISPQSSADTRVPILLSLAMIVRDGGQILASLLADAQPWVDEIVIGDTGSCDNSVAVAEAHNATVHHLEWSDDFAKARNQVLEQCHGAWVLVLDADELLCASTWHDLRAWVAKQEQEHHYQAGTISTRNYLPDRYGKRGWTPVPANDPYALATGAPAEGYVTTSKVRLFPNQPAIRFRGQIHETVETSLREAHIPIVDLPWPVHHFGYLQTSERKNKQYLHLAHLKTTEQPHSAQAWGELADCAAVIGDHHQALVAIERALVLDPDIPDYHLTAGWLAQETGDFTKAETHLATVMGCPEVDDHLLAEASHLRAQVALKSERPTTAVPLLAIALRLFPDNGHYQNTLGTLQLMLGRGQAAHEALTRACRLLPSQAAPCLNLAALLEAAGQPERASIHYAEALRRDPSNERAVAGIEKTTLVPELV